MQITHSLSFFLTQSTFSPIIMTTFFLVFVLCDKSFCNRTRHLFLFIIVSEIISMQADIIDYYISCQPKLIWARYVTSAISYTLKPFSILAVYYILRSRKSVSAIILTIPSIINAIVVFSSFYNGIVFYFDAQNNFYRGPLGYFPFITSGINLLFLIITSVRKFKINAEESAIVITIGIISIITVIIQSGFKYFFLINTTTISGAIFYYLFLHVQIYNRDPLTNLLNRRKFYLDLEKTQKAPLTIITFDLNNLKKYNDTYGHAAGDNALITVSECILSLLPNGIRFYRTGGDEFHAIAVASSILTVDHFIFDIQKELKKTPYRVAIGYAIYQPGMDIKEVMQKADNAMYVNKQRLKSEDN